MSDNTVSYEFDEESAGKADNFVGRIDKSDAYIGQFVSVNAMKAKSGTHGIHFEFKTEGDGFAGLDIYTKKEDGSVVNMGMNLLNAIQAVLGLRGLKSRLGKFEGFVEGKRQEIEGEIFPDLMNRDIGVVLQKELYTKNDGSDGYRINLVGVFHPTSRLTASEIKERVTKPEKLAKLMSNLKTKDSRVKQVEPSQPAVGADAGSY